MGEGDVKELRELVEFLKTNGVAEFDMERPELKVRLKFAGSADSPSSGGLSATDLANIARVMSVGGVAQAAAPSLPEPHMVGTQPTTETVEVVSPAAVDEEAGLQFVNSPLVGTFYDAPSPGAEPFVGVGDTVSSGKVLCIVEAMKIMNEIESDVAGRVVKVYAKAGQPIEYGQRLFGIRA